MSIVVGINVEGTLCKVQDWNVKYLSKESHILLKKLSELYPEVRNKIFSPKCKRNKEHLPDLVLVCEKIGEWMKEVEVLIAKCGRRKYTEPYKFMKKSSWKEQKIPKVDKSSIMEEIKSIVVRGNEELIILNEILMSLHD